MGHHLIAAMMVAQTLMAPVFNPHFSPRALRTESDAVAAFYEQWEGGKDGSWREDAENLEPWLKKVPEPGRLESARKELRGTRVGNEWVLHLGDHGPLDIHLDAATGRVKEIRGVVTDRPL